MIKLFLIQLIALAITYQEAGFQYQDKGATAKDYLGRDITSRIVITNNVNSYKVGTYSVTYNVTDDWGLKADPAIRTVVVRDTNPPLIQLKGSNPMKVALWGTYKEPGASAWDQCDGDITTRIIKGGSVNTGKTGTYSITYSCTDSAGNKYMVIRTVKVTWFGL